MYDAGLEVEFLDRVQAGAVAVLEAQIDRRGVGGGGGRAASRRTAPSFSVAVVVSLAARSVNGSGCDGRCARSSSCGCVLLIEIVLQAPAFQPRAPVGEHRDDVAGLDANVALGGVADQRRGQRRRRRRAGRRRAPAGPALCRWSPASAAGGRRGRRASRLTRAPAWAPASRTAPASVQHEEREKDGEKNASFHSTGPARPDATSGGWDGIVARGTQRVAAGQAPGGQPDAPHGAVTLDRLGSVVGARRQKPAGASKVRRNKESCSREAARGTRARPGASQRPWRRRRSTRFR